MSKTVFCDIDGVIFKQTNGVFAPSATLLPGVIDTFRYWEYMGYRVILTTGRKESLREFTANQLLENGLSYDLMVMGVGVGDRILVNDKNSHGHKKAYAINPDRNIGIQISDFKKIDRGRDAKRRKEFTGETK